MMSSIYLRSLFKYEPSLMALMGRCIYLQGTKIHCRSLPVCHYHFKLMQKELKVGGAWEWHQDYGYWYMNQFMFPDQLISVIIALTPANQENHLASYDDEFYLIKKETLPNGEVKVILKNKKTNEIIQC